MASTARKPYRKAPPQHREQRHATAVVPPAPASHLNLNQVITPSPPPPPLPQPKRHPHQVWDSDLDASSLSSLDQRPTLTNQATARGEQRRGQRMQTAAAPPPRGILKQPTPMGAELPYDTVRKSKSVELLGGGGGRRLPSYAPPTSSSLSWRRSSDPPTSCLEERRRFSHFLDEITRRVLSPARLSLLGRPAPPPRGSPAPLRRHRRHMAAGRSSCVGEGLETAPPSERTRRWDRWVAAVRRPNSLHGDWRPERAELLDDDVTEGAGVMQQEVVLWAGREGGTGKEPPRSNHRAAAAHRSPHSPRKVGSPPLAPPTLAPSLVAPPTLPLSFLAPPTVAPPTFPPGCEVRGRAEGSCHRLCLIF